MPFRLPADLLILNPPTSRNVYSSCRTFSVPPKLAVAPYGATLAFSETFSDHIPSTPSPSKTTAEKKR